MSNAFQVQIEIGRQEDGLWRVKVPGLQGCWADAPTLAEALADIQEGIVMALEDYRERGLDLPEGISALRSEPTSATLPVIVDERPEKNRETVKERLQELVRLVDEGEDSMEEAIDYLRWLASDEPEQLTPEEWEEVREGEREIERGEVYAWDDVKRELGL